MKRLLLISVIVLVSGCSGMEIGGKAWISRVDEKQESQRTYRANVPLKCYFTNCAPEASEAQGS